VLGLVLSYGWKRPHDAIGMMTMVGALLTVMCIISPESHTHYFCLPIPLIMALAYRSLESRPDRMLPTPATLSILIFAGFCFAIVSVPLWEMRREAGIPMYAALVLWIAAMRRLRSEPAVPAAAQPEPQQLPRAA
jgi:hypothetical protein